MPLHTHTHGLDITIRYYHAEIAHNLRRFLARDPRGLLCTPLTQVAKGKQCPERDVFRLAASLRRVAHLVSTHFPSSSAAISRTLSQQNCFYFLTFPITRNSRIFTRIDKTLHSRTYCKRGRIMTVGVIRAALSPGDRMSNTTKKDLIFLLFTLGERMEKKHQL